MGAQAQTRYVLASESCATKHSRGWRAVWRKQMGGYGWANGWGGVGLSEDGAAGGWLCGELTKGWVGVACARMGGVERDGDRERERNREGERGRERER